MRLAFCLFVTLCLLVVVEIARKVVAIQPTVEKVVESVAAALDLDNGLGQEWCDVITVIAHRHDGFHFDYNVKFPV